jgi:hypothetical protein
LRERAQKLESRTLSPDPPESPGQILGDCERFNGVEGFPGAVPAGGFDLGDSRRLKPAGGEQTFDLPLVERPTRRSGVCAA